MTSTANHAIKRPGRSRGATGIPVQFRSLTKYLMASLSLLLIKHFIFSIDQASAKKKKKRPEMEMDNVRGKILIEARKESSSPEEREQKLHSDDVLLTKY